MDLYLIPGLGADHRLFERLDLPGHQVHFLDWPEMPTNSSLKDFALALAPRIDGSKVHALIGVSMGGMVAQELAALTAPEKVIIISSWKGPEEMPIPIRALRGTHPERLLTKAIMKRTIPMVRWQMGVEDPVDVALFNSLLQVHSIEQLKVQINACLSWEGMARKPESLVHIHGDADRLMPITAIKDPISIAGGTHFMVFSKAAEVEREVAKALLS